MQKKAFFVKLYDEAKWYKICFTNEFNLITKKFGLKNSVLKTETK